MGAIWAVAPEGSVRGHQRSPTGHPFSDGPDSGGLVSGRGKSHQCGPQDSGLIGPSPENRPWPFSCFDTGDPCSYDPTMEKTTRQSRAWRRSPQTFRSQDPTPPMPSRTGNLLRHKQADAGVRMIIALSKSRRHRKRHGSGNPDTTTGLEGSFGSSMRDARRTAGRKSTAGGRLESCAEGVVRVQALQQAMPPEALRTCVAAVSPQPCERTRRRLRGLREPARAISRLTA